MSGLRISMSLFAILAFLPVSAGSLAANTALTDKLVEECEQKYQEIKDYTARIIRMERRDDGSFLKEEYFMKFKKPQHIYLKWLTGPHKGREALFIEGKNNNKIRAHEGGWLRFIDVNISPHGWIARMNYKRPVTQTSIGYFIERYVSDYSYGRTNRELELNYKGEVHVGGRKVHKLEAITQYGQSEYAYYCKRSIVYFDTATKLPIRFDFYDENDNLFEKYMYVDVQINQGLTAWDFNAANGEYDF